MNIPDYETPIDDDDGDDDDDIGKLELEALDRAIEETLHPSPERDRARDEKKRAEQAANEAREQAQQKAYIGALTDLLTISMEHKANAQISLLTQGMLECMTEATVLQSVHPTSAMKAPNAHQSVRHTELTAMARLSEASSRMLDAYVRLRRANNHDVQFQQVTRRKLEDGSVQQTMIRHHDRTTPLDDFDVGEEALAAARKRAAEKAPTEPAKS